MHRCIGGTDQLLQIIALPNLKSLTIGPFHEWDFTVISQQSQSSVRTLRVLGSFANIEQTCSLLRVFTHLEELWLHTPGKEVSRLAARRMIILGD